MNVEFFEFTPLILLIIAQTHLDYKFVELAVQLNSNKNMHTSISQTINYYHTLRCSKIFY